MFDQNYKLGPYTLVEKLGSGGFAEVWLGQETTSINIVHQYALKILGPAADVDAVQRETRLWLKASGHPNVHTIFKADKYEGHLVLISEYMPEGSLANRIRRNGKPSLEEAVAIICGVLSGLEHLHEQRIEHGDLNPSNILMKRGVPQLSDFGLARVLQSTAEFSQSSHFKGTFRYMAPEAFEGVHSVRTDIWSAGVIFYELAFGYLPFRAPGHAVIAQIQTQDVAGFPLGASEEIRYIITKALRKNPELRYQSASAMLKDLSEASLPSSKPWNHNSGRIGSMDQASEITVLSPTIIMSNEATLVRKTHPARLVKRAVRVVKKAPLPHERILSFPTNNWRCYLRFRDPDTSLFSYKTEVRASGDVAIPDGKEVCLRIASKNSTVHSSDEPFEDADYSVLFSVLGKLEQKGITAIDVNGGVEVSYLLPHIANIPLLKELDFWGARILNRDLQELAPGIPQVTKLTLYECQISDRGLRHLAALTNLRSLNLSHTEITDTGLEYLKDLTRLEDLSLEGLKELNGSGFRHLRNCKQLWFLNLRSSDNVSSAGVAHLRNNTKLAYLDLFWNSITDRGVSLLSELSELYHLNLGLTGITDKALSHLASLKNLEYLNVEYNHKITDEGLSRLYEMKKLARLNLAGTEITDTGLRYIREITTLTQLDLGGTQVTAYAVDRLRRHLPNLCIKFDDMDED